MFMDTSQEFQSSQGGVRWVASQSTNPALNALMQEAERDRRTRPSTPVHELASWTYPLSSTASFTSISTSGWHSSDNNSADAPYPPPLSGGSSSSSSASLEPRASDPSGSRRPQHLPSERRRPLASSTSSANHSTRPRSSSHSTAPAAAKKKYTPRDDEPEALQFIELLKQTYKSADYNSVQKQNVVRAKEKDRRREESLARSGIDNRTGPDTNNSSARPLTKTTSASAVYPVTSTRAPERTLTVSMSASKPESHGRKLAKEPSSGPPGIVSGKSTPTSLPSPNLNCDIKLAHASRLPTGPSNQIAACKGSFPPPNDGDIAMQDVIDLSETDTECQKPISGPISRADTAMCVESDDEESDDAMDVSFYKPEPPPRACAPAPKSNPRASQSTTMPRPLATTQRTRAGPPPLGMRRAPQPQPSQYGATQGTKGVTVPRFKPPLLAGAGGSTSKSGNNSKPATATSSSSSRPPPRGGADGGANRAPAAKTTSRRPQDPDSSFDVSFDVDPVALEEAMRPYD